MKTRAVLILTLMLALLVPAVMQAKAIRLEVEDFKGKGRLFTGKHYSGKGTYGKWHKLTQTVEAPEAGLWYLWVRYSSSWQEPAKSMGEANARKLRHFAIKVNETNILVDQDTGSDYGWAVHKVPLVAGKNQIELHAVGIDPYADVIVLTQDYDHIPEPVFHLKKNRKTRDKTLGRAQIPASSEILNIPRNKTNAISVTFKTAGGMEPKYPTTATIWHDGVNIYLHLRCNQPATTLVHGSTAGLWHDDVLEIIIDGNRSMADLRHLIVNPAGNTYFEKITGKIKDYNWTGNWDVTAQINPDHWQTSITIPLIDILDTMPEQPGKIRANFYRSSQNPRESSGWAPLISGFTDPKGCAELVLDNMSPSEWYKLWTQALNQRALALKVATIPEDSDPLTIWQLESSLTAIARQRFSPPEGQGIVFKDTNLLPNPEFEYGSVSTGYVAPFNWHVAKGGSATLITSPYQGQHAMHIIATEDHCIITPGTRPCIDSTLEYEWSGWFRSSNPKNTRATLQINWYLQDMEKPGGWGQIRDGGVSKIDFIPTTEWQEVKLLAKAPAGAVQCDFEVHLHNKGSTLDCDSFNLDGMGCNLVDFMVPQPGFDTKASKHVVIWSKGTPEPEFILSSGTKTILKKKLDNYGTSRWKGNTYHAKFSEITAPGNYKLTITLDGKEYSSHQFVIEDDLYIKHAKLASNFFYVQRQGVDIPGWHKANFLDDAILVDETTGKVVGHRDLSGGWQDAGDPSKQSASDMSIFGLAEFFENTQIVEYNLKEKFPDILALDWSEVDRQINKCYVGDGLFYSAAVNNISNARSREKARQAGYRTRSIHQLDPAEWTDNIPNTWDDRFTTHPPSLQWVNSGLSKFALSIRQYDQAISQQIAKIMAEDYVVRQKRQEIWNKDPLTRVARGDGELCRIAMHLYQLTNQENYKVDTDNYLREIIQAFDKQLYMDPTWHILISSRPKWSYYGLAITLFDYNRYFPNSAYEQDIKRVIKHFIDNAIIERAKDNEFGIVTHIQPGPGLRIYYDPQRPGRNPISRGGHNRLIASHGYLAARAARLLKDPSYLTVADRSAQWIVGRNPKATSMLIGNGWKFAATSTSLRLCKGHEDGVIPGAVIRGMSTRSDSPPDFPTLNISSNPGGRAISHMHEVYQLDTIYFLLVCQELHMAYQELL